MEDKVIGKIGGWVASSLNRRSLQSSVHTKAHNAQFPRFFSGFDAPGSPLYRRRWPDMQRGSAWHTQHLSHNRQRRGVQEEAGESRGLLNCQSCGWASGERALLLGLQPSPVSYPDHPFLTLADHVPRMCSLTCIDHHSSHYISWHS